MIQALETIFLPIRCESHMWQTDEGVGDGRCVMQGLGGSKHDILYHNFLILSIVVFLSAEGQVSVKRFTSRMTIDLPGYMHSRRVPEAKAIRLPCSPPSGGDSMRARNPSRGLDDSRGPVLTASGVVC